MDGASYEAYDPAAKQPIEDIFIAGWARKASTGLVGLARKDGSNGARALMQYLATLPAQPAAPRIQGVHERLRGLNRPLVTNSDLVRLEQAEREKAAQLGLVEFKFENNLEMLQVMGLIQPLVKYNFFRNDSSQRENSSKN